MGGRRGALASALCALSLLLACASVPPLPTTIKGQNPQQTRIYVMREPKFFSELGHPGIKVGDEVVGSLAPARFLVIDRAPGQYVVSVNSSPGYYAITVAAHAGSVHYLQVGLRPFVEQYLTSGLIPQMIEQASTGHNGAFTLVELSEPAGRAMLQKLMSEAG
jgi:hypothetical protein